MKASIATRTLRAVAATLLLTVAATGVAREPMSEADARAMKKYPSFCTASELPDMSHYLPAPPDTASMTYFNDVVQYQRGKALREGPRGRQAIFDAWMVRDSILLGFAPALGGVVINRNDSPDLFSLVNHVVNDACKSVERGKAHYMRKRPFVQFNETTLIPAEEASHRFTGSYPSSHAATGWAVALLLVEVAPEHAEAILERGYQYGQSRVIAGYHYQSDVDAARLAASGAFARIHANPAYADMLAKARRDWQRLTR